MCFIKKTFITLSIIFLTHQYIQSADSKLPVPAKETDLAAYLQFIQRTDIPDHRKIKLSPEACAMLINADNTTQKKLLKTYLQDLLLHYHPDHNAQNKDANKIAQYLNNLIERFVKSNDSQVERHRFIETLKAEQPPLNREQARLQDQINRITSEILRFQYFFAPDPNNLSINFTTINRYFDQLQDRITRHLNPHNFPLQDETVLRAKSNEFENTIQAIYCNGIELLNPYQLLSLDKKLLLTYSWEESLAEIAAAKAIALIEFQERIFDTFLQNKFKQQLDAAATIIQSEIKLACNRQSVLKNEQKQRCAIDLEELETRKKIDTEANKEKESIKKQEQILKVSEQNKINDIDAETWNASFRLSSSIKNNISNHSIDTINQAFDDLVKDISTKLNPENFKFTKEQAKHKLHYLINELIHIVRLETISKFENRNFIPKDPSPSDLGYHTR